MELSQLSMKLTTGINSLMIWKTKSCIPSISVQVNFKILRIRKMLTLGLFASAFIQVTCFLIASENLMHRMRKAFFKAILRQDIAWYDANHSGTLTSKLFDNLERIKEGTGDKVALAVQFLAQFFGGFVIGRLLSSHHQGV